MRKLLLLFLLVVITEFGYARNHSNKRYNHHNHLKVKNNCLIVGLVGSALVVDALIRPRTTIIYEQQPVYHPGHYEYRNEKIWIQEEIRKIWVSSVAKWDFDENGEQIRVVEPGHYEYQTIDGHYEIRQVQVWINEYWSY
jgi:hypothetical protein